MGGRRARARTVLLDALAVVLGVVIYFGVRGQTAGSPETAVRHAGDILALEAQLGLDVERGLQSALLHQESLTTVANWVYIWGHWPVIAVTLLWLAMHHRPVFRQLRDAMLVSGLLGLSVYTTYPVAPPRLAGLTMVDTVAEQSGAYRLLQPPAFVNQYAAMPSLHVGWDLLVGLAVVAAASTITVRALGVAMPLAMAGAVVLTANHYVLDVLAGAALGLVGYLVARGLEQRRAPGAMRAARPARGVAAPPRAPSASSPSAPVVPGQRCAPNNTPARGAVPHRQCDRR